MMKNKTFLWHDYETWGIHPALDRPAQFAAIRTDEDLNPIGEPIMLYAKPALDMLPHPEACLITGITPQYAWQNGVVEAQFIQRIAEAMMQPNTCSVGYNSIRFDDEFTRHTLYRNFYDAYEREWKNGNSRWDLIDVARLCGALRPEGLQWPKDENGLPSYRLEALTAANGIVHEGAHDALVDVRATITLAKLIKDKQPKLFDYALSMRDKQMAAKALDLGSLKPVFHISGMFGSKNYCASIVLPLCMHPTNKNAVICFDLRYSPEEFLHNDIAYLKQRLFTAQAETQLPLGLKNIHLNKSPMIAPVIMVTPEVEQRINLTLELARKHYAELKVNQAEWIKAQSVFTDSHFAEKTDPDTMLYSGGFFSNHDKRQMQLIREAEPAKLLAQHYSFEDQRLNTMLFRYKGRNFSDRFTEEEKQVWEQYRFTRLTQQNNDGILTMEDYQMALDVLYVEHDNNEKKRHIIEQLMEWGDQLLSIE